MKMKIPRVLAMTAVMAFLAGFWTACSVGFDPTTDEHKFSCNDDTDCFQNFICVNAVCSLKSAEPNCTDADGDGYGVGDTGSCPLCVSEAKCEEDCNDSDISINPGLADTCDGKDNNCNDEIDEVIACEENFDCPDESHPKGSMIPSCDAGFCVYDTPLNQVASGDPACDTQVACVGGVREDKPDACF